MSKLLEYMYILRKNIILCVFVNAGNCSIEVIFLKSQIIYPYSYSRQVQDCKYPHLSNPLHTEFVLLYMEEGKTIFYVLSFCSVFNISKCLTTQDCLINLSHVKAILMNI